VLACLSNSALADYNWLLAELSGGYPFSITDNGDVRNLCNILRPGYVPPARTTVTQSLLPKLYAAAKAKVPAVCYDIACMSFLASWYVAGRDHQGC
jgi:hypothetical protein